MEFGDIIAVASPSGLARAIYINEHRFSQVVHVIARLWLVGLILIPSAVAFAELWLGIQYRDYSKVGWALLSGGQNNVTTPYLPFAVPHTPGNMAFCRWCSWLGMGCSFCR